jgi:dipeptidyl aminopeptidase/acylaminoacyl peptidase
MNTAFFGAFLAVLSIAHAEDADWAKKELPVRIIPNVPESAEAYYAPDNLHVIAQTQDPAAQHAEGRKSGALTYTFTDTGRDIRRINDHGQDACSWFMPDGKHLIWTSTRDHMDMPMGNWSDDTDYPRGAELYISDLKGGHIRRLTNNEYYEAEVTVSPDGKWVFFGREIDGKMDIWRMRTDGTGEQQLTFTDDWQEGAPYPLPDNKHIIFRAWKSSEKARLDKLRKETGQRSQTPMTIFTMNYDGTDVQPRTFTKDMNWAPFPAPDGRHFVYVRVFDGNNWDVVMNDLAGGEPVRMTYNPGFDGFPSISPNGKKMLFARSVGKQFMAGLHTYVMDISSLNVGPKQYKGVPEKATPPAGWVPDPDLAAFERHSKAP